MPRVKVETVFRHAVAVRFKVYYTEVADSTDFLITCLRNRNSGSESLYSFLCYVADTVRQLLAILSCDAVRRGGVRPCKFSH